MHKEFKHLGNNQNQKNHMNAFYDNLKGVERVMYKTAFNFHKQHVQGATEESAHQAGLKELDRLGRLRKEADQPQTYVDLSTGRKFRSTEADLISSNS
jgi:hypothetical protein